MENSALVRMRIFEFLKDHAGDVIAVYKIIEDMLGKKPPENIPHEAKALYGLFGIGDELAFQRLLLQLKPREKEAIVGFLQWHFFENRRQSAVGGATVWWVGNAWRVYTTKLSNPGKKVGSVEITETEKVGGKTTQRKESIDTFSSGGVQSLEFLQKIARTINSAPTPEAGYEKVLKMFEAAGVPRMPSQEAIDWIEDNLLNFGQWFNFIKSVPVAINDWVDDRYEQIQQREEARTGFFGGIVRGLRKLI